MLQAAATYCAKTAPVLRRLTPAPGIARGDTSLRARERPRVGGQEGGANVKDHLLENATDC
jgi:hypothetical protein